MSIVDEGYEGSYTDADLMRIRSYPDVAQVEFHRELASTNDRALELAHSELNALPLLVLAERQTAGRGRGTNRWWAENGALTFSLLLQAHASGLPTSLWPQVSLATGLAICEAIEEFLDCSAKLKWPNDVYLRNRKVAGVLVEAPANRQGLLVVGIGINVNNSVESLPEEARESAIALCELAGRLALADVLLSVLARVLTHLTRIGQGNSEMHQWWRARCLLTNRHVHLDVGGTEVVGTCQGIDDDGALIVRTPDRDHRCFAGVVNRFE